MVGKRRYDEGCAVAHALDLLGERWALLVVRELMLGPKRFTDLRMGIPGASPDILTSRLRELKHSGVLRQRKLPPPASAQVYELTKWGAELEPVITHLGRWGSRSPLLPRNAHSSIDSLLLSLRSMFAPDAARDFNATITLRVDERPFHIEVSDGTFQLGGGESNTSTVVLETDRDTLAEMLYHGRTLKNAMHAGAATVTGPTTVAARFLQLFPQPQPADLD